ncbi:MAG TPA: hypothetical protein VGG91_17020 [Myxococcaceae bacterium]|jgi:hypothetical protein
MHGHGERRAIAFVLGWGLLACATASPSPETQRVIPVDGVPGPRCQNLGTVIGESQPQSWGSGETTGDQLVAQATAEAMQRAAERGATHIFLSPVTMREKDGAPFSATRTGVAFRCGGP